MRYIIYNLKRLTLMLALCLFTTQTSMAGEISVRIAKGDDDAEQSGSSKNYLSSSDLELVQDGRLNQTIGLRYKDLNIPAKANITSAYIQFTADEENSEPTNLRIHAEATTGSQSLTYATPVSQDPSLTRVMLSERIKTNKSVRWTPPAWSVGETSERTKTPDLKEIVQELVNRPTWKQGLADVTFIISGNGKRVAESYEGSRNKAAQLVVTWGDQDDSKTPTDPPIDGFKLKYGESINKNSHIEYENNLLALQDDGNLVLYERKDNGRYSVNWHSATYGKAATEARFTTAYGGFCILNGSKPVACAKTIDQENEYLLLSKNKFEIYNSDNQVVWSSATDKMVDPSQNTTPTDGFKFKYGDKIKTDSSIAHTSPNETFFLTLQKDGNLVLYERTNKGIQSKWSSKTYGKSTTEARFTTTHGGFCIMNGSKPVACAKTQDPAKEYLLLSQGKFEIYNSSNQVIWSNTRDKMVAYTDNSNDESEDDNDNTPSSGDSVSIIGSSYAATNTKTIKVPSGTRKGDLMLLVFGVTDDKIMKSTSFNNSLGTWRKIGQCLMEVNGSGCGDNDSSHDLGHVIYALEAGSSDAGKTFTNKVHRTNHSFMGMIVLRNAKTSGSILRDFDRRADNKDKRAVFHDIDYKKGDMYVAIMSHDDSNSYNKFRAPSGMQKAVYFNGNDVSLGIYVRPMQGNEGGFKPITKGNGDDAGKMTITSMTVRAK